MEGRGGVRGVLGMEKKRRKERPKVCCNAHKQEERRRWERERRMENEE
jgi:hypothetical protein